ncbi:hypothetical protein DN752_20990 [Echinicola strongylocentroti]|uniref:Schlafen group 3-like DNA/RNA helicase domain-containing protein n=1 Tax=Echinicola strongylocentroti TaxID=1795355 RepID=A0A2Z4INT4_9BACT|nr:ATP-binding protein [Echinicola strongylocentroti]AWW32419.1 hypothetical protein DN752_20990 [Echinicola strongylocentroti]
MKEINLKSLIYAHKFLEQQLFQNYCNFFGISPKDQELNDLMIFCRELNLISLNEDCFNSFYIGYTIPQISKEFDLLRFGKNYTLNIELKSSSTEEKIIYQLKKNKYYLSFLEEDIINFCFESRSRKLYVLDEQGNLIEDDFEKLLRLILGQEAKALYNIDTIFNPSNYLVSPFNSTERFMRGNYFLTNQQEEIKKKSLQNISSSGTCFISISGKAGTGKTLLTYDIGKEIMNQGHKCLVIHCGILNQGHQRLLEEFSWEIIAIRDLGDRDLSKYFLVIIDETQRIYPNQLKQIISSIKASNINCIFSFDMQQYLKKQEAKNNIENFIQENTSGIHYQLTTKIRTNKEIASFIMGILNRKNKIHSGGDKSNIELTYFKKNIDAKNYIKTQTKKGWKSINYTPDSVTEHPYTKFQIYGEDNAHNVIGQEFDKVIAVIDSHFFYNERNDLSTRGYARTPYYHPTQMLIQIMSRTRRKLNLIIINNEEILERALEVIN